MAILFVILACSATLSLDTASPAPHPTLTINTLQLEFIGQDGAGYAGRLCTDGTAPDNVHLHLNGLRTEAEAISFRVDEPAGGGVWATPCDPISIWQLHVITAANGQFDLYFKPFRDAPAGAEYIVTVQCSDGEVQKDSTRGTRVKP